ncbi:hypothetical protein ACIG0C_06820 [Kitasatospora aureofaciens]|uniref:Uncharacterized protein n=1 Tax=Kitasatospora aureofaciens TaxID=1894 RepID=A0A1E7N6R9_KITAU|nr:hypothetical protein [Kitasatospora aureofaciens]ARF82317.1 hypothetical protein B6264_28660 [Kitasatospora aureofaciens]OEV36392.1 hypothetical protein HS99_0030005 [Kitasatospora aureofaciens]UKZ04171.1 hypothetical protein BOQ63_008875 [Streptomyces viridifaciens]GGU71118.1 hypothetical protein GCM10010502_23400 [Kitasatospora aureofaciens]
MRPEAGERPGPVAESAEPRGPAPGTAEWHGPAVVLPLWRRWEGGEERRNADRPGVLRGHPGPVVSDQPEAAPDEA